MIFRSKIREFTILSITPGKIGGCVFKRTGTEFRIAAHVMEKMEDGKISDVCRNVLKSLGHGRESILILTGSIPKGVFFRCLTGNLVPKLMRSAIELELPLRIPADTQNMTFQFATSGKADEKTGEIGVNVYAFPEKSLQRLELLIAGGVRKADAFLYPFVGLAPEDPPLYLPEIEKDFFFASGEWHSISELDRDSALKAWEKKISAKIRTPEKDFSFSDYLGILAVAEYVSGKNYQESGAGLDILPKALHPSRYRTQLCITGALLLILVGMFLWSGFGRLHAEQKRYKSLQAELGSLQRQLQTAKTKLKSSEKETREISRVVNLTAGEHNLLGELAILSEVLPSNVMVFSFRLGDSAIDLTLQSEAESLNIPTIMKKLVHWKVASTRQFRRNNDAGSTVMVKLVSAEEPEK